MDAEILKIRRLRNCSESVPDEYIDLGIDYKEIKQRELNMNLSGLYYLCIHNQIDIDEFVKSFVANVYIVLDIFNDMGVYPDYFYDKIVEMNIGFEKLKQNNKDIWKDRREFNHVYATATKELENGLKNRSYSTQGHEQRSINDAFSEMVNFSKAFGLPYCVNTNEQYIKAFDLAQSKHNLLTEQLVNNDDVYEDIECLAKLLFEYLKFFVAIGINPYEELNKYIEKVENEDVKRRSTK